MHFVCHAVLRHLPVTVVQECPCEAPAAKRCKRYDRAYPAHGQLITSAFYTRDVDGDAAHDSILHFDDANVVPVSGAVHEGIAATAPKGTDRTSLA